nr:AIM24 family protein [Actinopolyspora sp. BKK2]
MPGGVVQVRTRHSPSFGVARLVLAAGEVARTGSEAMANSYGVTSSSARGAGKRGPGRFGLGGGSASEWSYTAGPQGGWVDVAPSFPGDVHTVEMDGRRGWCVARRSWLAAAGTVRLDAGWNGFRELFGGQPGFLAHASGQGQLVLACCGALDVHELQPGQFVTMDAGHLVAYVDTLQCRLRQSEQGRAQSMRTGDGLVVDFAGPGRVVAQSRNPHRMSSWSQRGGSGR